ncbi:MAG: beta-ketoacyl-[acyl-carrier-protein] synthase II, partial [Bacteroidales bacterium]|nr:beta-ketoacyl-[acyl-carrier-protein] synthase II [Bacteroidales bacterium]
RPFDKDRDGFVLGEGGCAIFFEEYEHAIKRGAKIYAEVAGAGLSADAYHMTSPHPEGLGASLSMQAALEDAEMNPEDIDHINTHGTSTPLGDISEPLAIKTAFGDHAYKININSTKSMTGHLLGAAGAVEAIATILAIQNNVVPPTINHFTDDPDIDNKLNFTYHNAQERVINAALSNTFGFGGHNVSLIFKKFEK